jgi:hypothetical protein
MAEDVVGDMVVLAQKFEPTHWGQNPNGGGQPVGSDKRRKMLDERAIALNKLHSVYNARGRDLVHVILQDARKDLDARRVAEASEREAWAWGAQVKRDLEDRLEKARACAERSEEQAAAAGRTAAALQDEVKALRNALDKTREDVTDRKLTAKREDDALAQAKHRAKLQAEKIARLERQVDDLSTRWGEVRRDRREPALCVATLLEGMGKRGQRLAERLPMAWLQGSDPVADGARALASAAAALPDGSPERARGLLALLALLEAGAPAGGAQ